MKRMAYLSSSRLAELRFQLSESDWLVLRDVEAMRLVSATDLQALQALRGELHVRSFRRQLQHLTERRVLERLDRVVGGRRAGSAGYVYVLGRAGQQLLSAESAQTQVRRTWTPRPAWLAHALAASHLYVVLRQHEAIGQLKVVTFETEPATWRQFSGGAGAQSWLKPDACIVTEQDGYRISRFVEVDCATESPATLRRKLDLYWQYFVSGQEQLSSGVFPSVLWLVPSERRRAVLRSVVGQQEDQAQALHDVRLYQDAAAVRTEEPP